MATGAVTDRPLNSNWNNSMAGHSTPSLQFALVASVVLILTTILTLCFSLWRRWRSKPRRTSSPSPSSNAGAIAAVFVNASPASLAQLAPPDALASPDKAASWNDKDGKITTLFPVVMPGDDMPKFVARICPQLAAHVSEDEIDDREIAGIHIGMDL